MSKIALTPNASGTGTLTIAAPNTNVDRTLTLPDATGTVTVAPAGAVNFTAAPSGALTVDASGNLGLGVTPSAWGTSGSTKALQVSTRTALFEAFGGGGLNVNSFFDGTSDKYIVTGQATKYIQNIGRHEWYTAPSGTAGNAITFTQAMTLDAAGRLMVPNQPAFFAYTTNAGAANATVVYLTATVNRGNHYNTSTGLFTAPVAGTYVFHSTTFGNTQTASTSYFHTVFQKNGVSTGPIAHSQYNDIRNYETVTATQLITLAANDTVSVYITAGQAYEYGGPYSHFSGYLIG